jgi:methionine sulfoxide reductase heme-binding subunit
MRQERVSGEPATPSQRASSERRLGRRLVRHHLPLAMLSGAMTAVLAVALPAHETVHRLSMATAYVGLVLLGITLSIGPWQVLRGRPSPTSSDLRRDVGIWTALVSLAHVVLGLQVHMGDPWLYFLHPLRERGRQGIPIRFDEFGVANHTGLIATLVLLLLLSLSNDLSLRALGAPTWKWLQRSSYVLFGLVVVHSILYQHLEKRELPLVVAFGLLALAPTAMQAIGFSLRKRRPVRPRED